MTTQISHSTAVALARLQHVSGLRLPYDPRGHRIQVGAMFVAQSLTSSRPGARDLAALPSDVASAAGETIRLDACPSLETEQRGAAATWAEDARRARSALRTLLLERYPGIWLEPAQ